MAQTYFAILTAIGEAKLANATALGTTLQLTKMAVGDGNGATPIPNRNQTALVHENRRAPLNTLFVDPANASQIVAEQIIPEDIGGWWIREIGLYDAAGDLCAVANCPDTYKPVLASGSGRTQIIRMVLIVANTQAVELKVDPSVVLAPRGYVDQTMAAHAAAADPHPQYATDADFAAHNAAADPHPQYLTGAEGDAKVAAAVAALVASSPAALDTLKELAAALGNDANFASTMTNALAGKMPVVTQVIGTTEALDALRISGFYIVFGANGDGEVLHIQHPNATGYAAQLMFGQWGQVPTSSGVGFSYRAMISGTWTAWQKIWHAGNFTPANYAPLASPPLTGTPTTPTAPAGTNTTQIASTAFVQAAVAALVASSPAALDTLNELATALGNDPNFAATVTNALAGKVGKDAQGNIGLGVIPKTWDTQYPVIQINAKTVIAADVNSSYYGTNWYHTAGVYKRLGAGFALMYHQDAAAGKHIWKIGANGANDSGVAWVDAMTLDAATGALDVPSGITLPTQSPGDSSSKGATTAFVQAAIAAQDGMTPVGIPKPWPLSTPPTGWAICQGQIFDKVAYPKLAVAYPSGVLPDLRGVHIVGYDGGRGLDTLTLGQYGADAMPAHTHSALVQGGGSAHTVSNVGDAPIYVTNGQTGSTGSGSKVRVDRVAFNYIVRLA